MFTILLAGKKEEKEKLHRLIQKLDEVIISTTSNFWKQICSKTQNGFCILSVPKELQKFGFTDINKALRTVPGVIIV